MQFDLVGEIVERRLRAGDARLCLGDLGFIIGGIDLNQEIAGLDVLEVVHSDGQDLAGNPATQTCQVGADIGIVGGLDRGAAGPFVPAIRRERDEAERDDDREQRDRKPPPETGRGFCQRHTGRRGCRSWRVLIGERRDGLFLLTHEDSSTHSPAKSARGAECCIKT